MNITRYFSSKRLCFNHLFGFTLLLSFNLFAQGISLEQAEQIALESDPAQQIYQSQQAALIAQGIAGSALPDPMVKLGVANLPTDSFALDKDPMTQLTLGLSQQFSRGEQRELTQKGFNQQSALAVLQGQDRQLLVKQNVQQLWFSLLFVEKSQQLLNEKKALFSGFYRDLQAKFALGLSDSEDLIAAEIELNLFDNKIAELAQQALNYRALLSEWIGQYAYQPLPDEIPQWSETLAYLDVGNGKQRDHYALLSRHPKAKLLAQNVQLADNSIALAEQDYKPSFKVEVGYGHRFSEDAMGEPRADLLSGFVSMDLPLFTDKRQDQKRIAAQQIKGQKQAEQRLLLRQLNTLLMAEIVNYQQLKERQNRYQESLLKQAKVHAKLLEESYQSNTRAFKEVIDAYIHEKNLSLEYQQLYFDGLKSLSKIRYFQAL